MQDPDGFDSFHLPLHFIDRISVFDWQINESMTICSIESSDLVTFFLADDGERIAGRRQSRGSLAGGQTGRGWCFHFF